MGTDFGALQVRAELGLRIPDGSSIDQTLSAMHTMGFSCSKGQGKFLDENAHEMSAPNFFWCTRETGYFLVCIKRADVTLIPSDNKIIDKHISVGLVCL